MTSMKEEDRRGGKVQTFMALGPLNKKDSVLTGESSYLGLLIRRKIEREGLFRAKQMENGAGSKRDLRSETRGKKGLSS